MSRFVAFHGNFTPNPPHEQEGNYPGFHAGTLQAAQDLLRMKVEMPGNAFEVPQNAYMHMYAVHHPVSPEVLDDPGQWEPESGRPNVDELNTPGNLGDDILQYKNSIEDEGSTSYVIPKHLIDGRRVSYLGSQFWGEFLPDE